MKIVISLILVLFVQNDLFKDTGKDVPKDQRPFTAVEEKTASDCIANSKTACPHLKAPQVAALKTLVAKLQKEKTQLKAERASLTTVIASKNNANIKKQKDKVRALRNKLRKKPLCST